MFFCYFSSKISCFIIEGPLWNPPFLVRGRCLNPGWYIYTTFICEYLLNIPKIILKFVKHYYIISHLYICIGIVTNTLYSVQSLSLNGRRGSTDGWRCKIPLHFCCLLLPSGNLQTSFQSSLWRILPVSSSVLMSLIIVLFIVPYRTCQRILRWGHTILISLSSPLLGDHHALLLHSGFD